MILLAYAARQLETAGSICKTALSGGCESPEGDLAGEARNLSCRAQSASL